jgi:hypothetical protein
MSELNRWIEQKNEEIRGGQGAIVRQELMELVRRQATSPIVRSEAPAIAALCRRTGIHLYALLILHRYVRPKAREPLDPSPVEILEYAGALAQIWAEEEAFALLKTVPVTLYPQVDLFRSFAHFQRWEYGSAVPLLERYIASPRLDDYARLIGKVNLSAALVTEMKCDEASDFLVTVLSEVEDYPLLKGNLLEISAQNLIHLRRFSEAREALEKSRSLLISSGSIDSFFVEKWLAILDLYENKPFNNSIAAEAKNRKQWETAREWDYHLGLTQNNRSILERCYFGTPFPKYRQRLKREARIEFAQNYEWIIGNPKGKRVLNLDGNSEDLKPGFLIHRLLKILASDFYRPHHWVSLHSKLFPGNYLNPISSGAVIHQLVKRARLWLSINHPALEIGESQSSYFLFSNCGTRIMVNLEPTSTRGDPYFILWKKSGRAHLSVKEAITLWKVERHTAIRIFNRMIGATQAVRDGAGPTTRYRLL